MVQPCYEQISFYWFGFAVMLPGRLLLCDYCDTPATFCASSEHVYHGRNYGPIWHCASCDAWVGCHKGNGGTRPLGGLANAELRNARRQAHVAFDPVWQKLMPTNGCSKAKARGNVYVWLADKLGIDPTVCHIGMFDIDLCARTVETANSAKA